MQTFPFDIEYFVADSGKKPFKEWLAGLKDIAGRAKIRVRLDRARLGNLGDNRPVGKGVLELKIAYGPGYRIYFALDGNRLILLLLGGDKSTQTRDIAKAREYWQEHQKRNTHDKENHISK
ncbi:MAG: addiction module protein [Deltaproteobacteria bacterium RIFOXYD12_FULL_55_16]|nr:MAG: addiction module protein [Deltaproteobacteria bacterium RIFOXYD12_FULL_55_16]